jgi:hypothetical protein
MKYRYWKEWTPAWKEFCAKGGHVPPEPHFYEIGFWADGTLYNPDGCPEDEARAIIEPRYLKWKD